jgi:hypothetical protein
MMPMRMLALALVLGAAKTATAQSGAPQTPVAPAAAPVVKLQAPPVAPPPPRPAPLIPASQRTPTPPISLKAAPAGGASVASHRPDSTRGVAPAMSVAPAAPAARVAAPPRTRPVAAASTISMNVIPATQGPPAGATMRCKDGTYLTGAPSAARCVGNGGVAMTYPAQAASPPAPKPQPQRKQP